MFARSGAVIEAIHEIIDCCNFYAAGRRCRIKDRQGTWIVENLPFGTYAVLAHHDIDASGKMERHWYGKPKEPTGAFNDAPARFGPPKFKHAKFEFAVPSLTLTITVK